MISAIMWAIMMASLIYIFHALARFSEELGEALHLRSYYALYHLTSPYLSMNIQLKFLSEFCMPVHTLEYTHWCGTLSAFGSVHSTDEAG